MVFPLTAIGFFCAVSALASSSRSPPQARVLRHGCSSEKCRFDPVPYGCKDISSLIPSLIQKSRTLITRSWEVVRSFVSQVPCLRKIFSLLECMQLCEYKNQRIMRRDPVFVAWDARCLEAVQSDDNIPAIASTSRSSPQARVVRHGCYSEKCRHDTEPYACNSIPSVMPKLIQKGRTMTPRSWKVVLSYVNRVPCLRNISSLLECMQICPYKNQRIRKSDPVFVAWDTRCLEAVQSNDNIPAPVRPGTSTTNQWMQPRTEFGTRRILFTGRLTSILRVTSPSRPPIAATKSCLACSHNNSALPWIVASSLLGLIGVIAAVLLILLRRYRRRHGKKEGTQERRVKFKTPPVGSRKTVPFYPNADDTFSANSESSHHTTPATSFTFDPKSVSSSRRRNPAPYMVSDCSVSSRHTVIRSALSVETSTPSQRSDADLDSRPRHQHPESLYGTSRGGMDEISGYTSVSQDNHQEPPSSTSWRRDMNASSSSYLSPDDF